MTNTYINGTFIDECPNRFLCKVSISGQEHLCYLSSSSKLAPFIDLRGSEVLLTKNANPKSKTKYTVYAVKATEGYILLNLTAVNTLLLTEFKKPESIYKDYSQIFREKTLLDPKIKVDFLIESTPNTVIEAKGIISNSAIAYFPSMKVERAISQLNTFLSLLKKGYSVHYYVVLMSPQVQTLKLEKNNRIFRRIFLTCIKKGMQVFFYRTTWGNGKFSLSRDLVAENSFM